MIFNNIRQIFQLYIFFPINKKPFNAMKNYFAILALDKNYYFFLHYKF
jgi:hypothetical protein